MEIARVIQEKARCLIEPGIAQVPAHDSSRDIRGPSLHGQESRIQCQPLVIGAHGGS
jgi:hypothetical protein